MTTQSDQEWLLGVILGASSSPEDAMGSFSTTLGTYYVLREIGETDQYSLFLCRLPSNQKGILKIAKEQANNPLLENEALILRLMSERAAEIEQERPTTSKPFNYQFFFPRIVESYVASDQGGRRVTILGFPDVLDSPLQLDPLARLIDFENIRVDPRTSAWILGKTLKVLAFAHDQGITNGRVSTSNILIERDQHGVVLFDWTDGTIFPDGIVPQAKAREEIQLAAQSVLRILGGNPQTGILLPDSQLTDSSLQTFLTRLLRGGITDAHEAHDQFYTLIYNLWPRGFHPFTSYPQ